MMDREASLRESTEEGWRRAQPSHRNVVGIFVAPHLLTFRYSGEAWYFANSASHYSCSMQAPLDSWTAPAAPSHAVPRGTEHHY